MDDLKKAFQSPEGRAAVENVVSLEKLSSGVHGMIYELKETL